jgi:hypothetical protein
MVKIPVPKEISNTFKADDNGLEAKLFQLIFNGLMSIDKYL